jgi:hypothetical protein
MTSITYLMAGLPSLVFPDPPPLSGEAFREACRPWLSPPSFGQVVLAGLDIETVPRRDIRHPLLRKWIAFESTLRNELVSIRSRRTGRESPSFREADGGFEGPVKSRLLQLEGAQNPLDAEILLLRFRWDFLEEETALHHFDLYAVLGYALKTGILERVQCFDREEGRKKLQSFIKRQDHELSKTGNHTRR